MKKFVCLGLLITSLLSSVQMGAQDIRVNSVRYLQTNLMASTNPRTPVGESRPCAVVIVEIPSGEGFHFPQAVGDVVHTASQYFVYLKDGQTFMDIVNPEGKVTKVDFDDMGFEIQSKCTYKVDCTVLQTVAVVFNVMPEDASLSLNGEPFHVMNGVFRHDYAVGDKLTYVASADGFSPVSGELTVNEAENIITLRLEQEKQPVKVSLNTGKASVFINNELFGEVSDGETILIPSQSVVLRFSAEGYEDETIQFDPGKTTSLTLKLGKVSNRVKNQSKTLKPKFDIFAGAAVDIIKNQDMVGSMLFGGALEVYLRPRLSLRLAGELNWTENSNGTTSTSSSRTGQGEDKKSYTLTGFSAPLSLSFNKPFAFNKGFWSFGVGPALNYKETAQENSDFYCSARADLRWSYSVLAIGGAIDYSDHFKVLITFGLRF